MSWKGRPQSHVWTAVVVVILCAQWSLLSLSANYDESVTNNNKNTEKSTGSSMESVHFTYSEDAGSETVVFERTGGGGGGSSGGSFSENLSGNLFAAIFSPIFIFGCVAFIFYNERRAKKRADTIAEIVRDTVEFNPNSKEECSFVSDFDGRLVHLVGQLRLKDGVELSDDLLPEPIPSVLALKREVMMLQWVEKKKTENVQIHGESGQKTTYWNKKEWSSSVIDSSSFHSKPSPPNPPDMPFHGAIRALEQGEVFVGSYGAVTLSKSQIGTLCDGTKLSYDPMRLSKSQCDHVSSLILGAWKEKEMRSTNDGVSKHDDRKEEKVVSEVYISRKERETGIREAGKDSSIDGMIGDLRVRFSVIRVVPDHDISVTLVGKLCGNVVHPYTCRTGTDVMHVIPGVHSIDNVVRSETQGNTFNTYVLRVVSLLLLAVSFTFLGAPVSFLIGYFPILGPIIAQSITFTLAAIGFVVGLFALFVAWIVARYDNPAVLGASFVIVGIVVARIISSKWE
eukprot:TRINITY_DN2412_c1_g4_i1.p1 TRINITY_DN2412_c1_g4~~TRINITY_DN2412_c1_g4_i1.p1  ORF type:complete len:511 (-),score=134.19 TRINITY_DN2412_c1_g4_i1:21-1553(-)